MSNNNTNTQKTTFWKFLTDNTIEIPIIQRDYAQGREGKEHLRKKFLSDLKVALDKGEELKLDFVYGSKENNKLNPLDGQQRLTTLWLLHWYIALRSGRLTNANTTLNKFTYETRISSREFCKELCETEKFENYCFGNIVEYIKNQTWFFSAWKQDPTIQSMLRMLGGTKNEKGEPNNDGIEQVFNCSGCEITNNEKQCKYEKYWELLAESDECPIIFYYLPLNEFKLTDDLYIKMNARGEQLTSFENFKADLIGYITKQKDNKELNEKERKNWENLLDEQTGIPIKMDTDWTNIFWKNKSQDYKIDEIYFAFLNRFFWNKCFITKDDNDSYILDIGKGDENSTQENDNLSYRYLNNSGSGRDDYDTTISYKGLDVYKYFHKEIPFDLFSDLQIILDNYSKYLNQNNNLQECLGCCWDKDFKYIPIYGKDKNGNHIELKDTDGNKIWRVSHLTQVQRVVFYSICKYFKEEEISSEADVESLKRWMRVVWNLVSGEDKQGPQIRSTSAMRKAIVFISNLNSHEVYQSLLSQNISDNSEFDERCKEEIEKADQILNGSIHSDIQKREDIIIKAENLNFEFFKGSIRFLFHDAKGDVDWADFDIKWRYASTFFKDGTVISTIELAKYCNDTQIQIVWTKFSFETSNWKFLLLQKSISDPIHKFLTGSNCFSNSTLYVDIKNLLSVIKETNVWLLDWPNMKCEIALTNYKVRKTTPSNGWVFEVGNDIRNHWNNMVWQMFSQNNSPIEIYPPEAWGEKQYNWLGQVYYRGLWTNFKYNYNGTEYFFTYYGDNTIYLMNDNWEGKQFKPNASDNYSFKIDVNVSEADFKKNLDTAIKDYLKYHTPTTVSVP